MSSTMKWQVLGGLMIVAMLAAACGPAATPTQAPPATEAATMAPEATTASEATMAPTTAPTPFTFGMLLVGAKNDQGWSQATFEGGQYVEQNLPGSKMVYLENVYSGSPSYPGQTASQLAQQLVQQGAQLVIFNSDDMKDEALKFAQANPTIDVIGVSDDWTWKDGKNYQASPNQIDVMGRMEYGKMIAGCAAALTTQTGQIGYLGPLINDETRRLASSAYLGAKYCWTHVLNKDAANLQFKVTWIGFWFNIPGVTSDPTQVADDFYNSGFDVVISGIDTTEALVEAKKMHDAGQSTFALAYDFKDNCNVAPDICLGVPYFNWGPAFLTAVKSAADGTWQEGFQWNGPDWADINNPDTSAVGFTKGAGLSADASTQLDGFISELAGGLDLWTGPVNLQDGTPYLTDGVAATDQQVWYLPQLLEGMQGQSVSQ
jgi:simple sugar transport system substrate-binding protein